jgi:hypothetical protein
MPRPRKDGSLDALVASVAVGFAHQITQLVRQELLGEITRVVHGKALSTAPGPSAARKTKKYNSPTHCIAPGCNKSHGGPRSGWFCEEHAKLPAAAKAKIKARRQAGGGATARKAAASASKPKKRKVSRRARKKARPAAKKRRSAKPAIATRPAPQPEKEQAPTATAA